MATRNHVGKGWPCNNLNGEERMREESLLQKIGIGIIFIGFLVFWMWVPDFTLDEQDCMKQESSAYVKNLCSEPQAK